MNKYILALGLSAAALAASADVKTDFAQRSRELASTGIFAPLDTMTMTPEEREAMEFIYAYSPLPDLADRSADFMLANVKAAIKARKEMGWNVPDREWTYFVLPTRINNEPLDSARLVFYDEIKPRLKGLSMADAILEVNHWTHEKASYQPSDGRTRSPQQTVAAAIGRCGEESTFLVAALRAMGIPARQVYTPRWAHTDDNHAWVEAWADGKWYFLGACEPEPVLNLGWFNAPASRGMLMNTRVFGAYDGPEEKLVTGPGYTVINVTSNYAPVRDLVVEVTDQQGKPLKDATVRYGLYNYAEFYPLASLTTGADGRTSLQTGLGDVLVWATDGIVYDYAHATATDSVIRLTPSASKMIKPGEIVALDMVAPPSNPNLPPVTPEQRAENDRRFAREDSIRNAYIHSAFASEEQLAALPEDVRGIVANMRSNHRLWNLMTLSSRPDSDVIALFKAISRKDLGDAPYEIIESALSRPGVTDIEYVMNPRIYTEELTAWWKDLDGFVDEATAARFRANPDELAAYVADNIALVKEQWEPTNAYMSPGSVWRTRLTNSLSRDIFYVAAARTLGIPSRLDPVTSIPQWRDTAGAWHDVLREAAAEGAKGNLILEYADESGYLPDPKYYSHFTVSRLDNGLPTLLTYDENEASAQTTFAAPGSPLAPGDYIITSGRRMADGNVLAALELVRIDTTGVVAPLQVRTSDHEIQVIGSFDSESRFQPLGESDPASILSKTGRGYYILGILDSSEPSTHALNDLAAVADELEADGRKIVLLSPTEAMSNKAVPTVGTLPNTIVKGMDTDGKIAAAIAGELNLDATTGHLPIFIIADTFNRIVFVSSGYTIGLGRTILDNLGRLGAN